MWERYSRKGSICVAAGKCINFWRIYCRISILSFEFLAYSQSALKQYTVWFVTPFRDGNGRLLDAESIRGAIGSAWPRELLQCPARYAARLSQAFTATEFSVMIESDQKELRTLNVMVLFLRWKCPVLKKHGRCNSQCTGTRLLTDWSWKAHTQRFPSENTRRKRGAQRRSYFGRSRALLAALYGEVCVQHNSPGRDRKVFQPTSEFLPEQAPCYDLGRPWRPGGGFSAAAT